MQRTLSTDVRGYLTHRTQKTMRNGEVVEFKTDRTKESLNKDRIFMITHKG